MTTHGFSDLSFDGFDQAQAAAAIRRTGEALRPLILQAAASILVTILVVATETAAENARQQLTGRINDKLLGS